MNEKQGNVLANMKVSSALIKLSLPATVAMLVNALYNIIDTIFVGNTVGNIGISGLTIAFPIQMLVLGIGAMFGMGCASVASRFLGEGKNTNADITVSTTIFFNAVVAAIMVVLGLIFIEPILKLFGASPENYPYAYDYMKIIIPGFMFYTFSVSMNHTVRAEGQATVAMISMLIGALGNIILDFIFIWILDWGVEGAAYATVSSQLCSTVFLIIYLKSGKSNYHVGFKKIDFTYKTVGSVMSVGSSAFFMQAGTSLLATILNHSLYNLGGDLAVAVYGVINKVTSLLIMPVVGIRQGTQPILGFSYGAENYKRAKETIKTSLKYMVVYSIISYTVVMVFAPFVVSLFGGDADLISEGTPALRIVILFVFLAPVQILASSTFQSFGKAILALVTSMLRQFIFLIPLIILIPIITELGLAGIWISFPIAEILSSVVCIILLKREINLLDELETSKQLTSHKM